MTKQEIASELDSILADFEHVHQEPGEETVAQIAARTGRDPYEVRDMLVRAFRAGRVTKRKVWSPERNKEVVAYRAVKP